MSNCGLVEFSITDGTVVIDLLAANKHGAGFGVQGYVQGRPQMKDGGIWQDSNTEAGRKLVFGVNTNIVDVVTLICGAGSQSQIIEYFKVLDLLLDKMTAYWTTNWQPTPVYLRARAKGETATRYALIHYAKYDEYFNPYGEHFAGNGFKVCTEEFALGIEHGVWLDLVPGESEGLAITHEKNSGDPINATGSVLTNEGLIVGNMHQATDDPGQVGGLLYILRNDGGTFSSNLLDGSPPYNLINSAEATGDAIYFGGENPFFGLVFNLTALSAGSTRAWEYWNGTAWTAFTPRTNSSNPVLTSTGVSHARWGLTEIGDWVKTTVDTAPYLYWVRVRTTSGGGAGPLTQGTRHVYATSVNFIEVGADQIQGTETALAKFDIDLWHTESGAGSAQRDGPFVWIGLRSADRGDRFAAQLNVGTGNPNGITFQGTASGILADDEYSPGGATITATNLSSLSEIGRITFSSFDGIHAHYFGQFRLFARIHSDDDTAASQMRYRLCRPIGSGITTITVITGETKSIPDVTGTERNLLIDLGYITLPFSNNALYTEPTGTYILSIDALVPSAKTVTLVNVILMPVDEWTAEIDGKLVGNAGALEIRLDGIGNPKTTRAYVDMADDLNPTVSGFPTVGSAARQRFWFLFRSGAQKGAIEYAASIRLAIVERNMSLRSYS